MVGRIGPAHGLDGTVVVDVETDRPRERFAPGERILAGDLTLTVTRYQTTDRSPLVTFEEVRGREHAERLRGTVLTLPGANRRDLDGDEFWPDDLIGLTLVDEEGNTLGSVIDVEFGAAQSRLIVQTEAGERWVPFVEEFFPDIDPGTSRLIGRLPPGLMD